MFSSKYPDDSLEAHTHFPYIPPTICISILFMTSLNDIMIICFPLLAGKALCMCRKSHAGLPACLPASPLTVYFSYAWTILSILYPKFWAWHFYISRTNPNKEWTIYIYLGDCQCVLVALLVICTVNHYPMRGLLSLDPKGWLKVITLDWQVLTTIGVVETSTFKHVRTIHICM